MHAIIEDSGRQLKVSEGDLVNVDLRKAAAKNDTIEFDRVLLVHDGKKIKVGTPLVAGAKVVAKVIGPAPGPKVRTLKYKRRKRYRRRVGHRQKYCQVRISKIVA